MTFDPKARTRRQREPKRAAFIADRHKAATICNAVVARNGITEATRDAVRALGAGEADDWNEDGLEGEWAASGENGGQGDE